jgi:TolB protein
MARVPTLVLLTVLISSLMLGCSWFKSTCPEEKAAPQKAATVATPGQPAPGTTPPATLAPSAAPGSDIMARSKEQKDSISYGRLKEELDSPIGPVFKTRTIGEMTQITFTRVGGDTDVDVSAKEDLVAFSSDRHSQDHNIYTKSVAGTTVTQKTFTPFDEIQPKLSPDGQKIAFASNKNGSYDIWLMDAHANGTATQVTFGEEDDLHPSWTPDGGTIIYCSYSSRTGDWSIMATSLGTGEVRDLGPGKFPDVSPDGNKILFQRARQRDGYWYSIWTMNLDGTDQTEIIASADWAAINPCWSPDGKYIAFATVNKSPQAKLEDRIWQGDNIYIVGVDGRGLLQLTDDNKPDWAPCWSQRDGRVYFVSERNGFRNIWSVKPPIFTVASTPAAADAGK